jgi:hypothetical protein
LQGKATREAPAQAELRPTCAGAYRLRHNYRLTRIAERQEKLKIHSARSVCDDRATQDFDSTSLLGQEKQRELTGFWINFAFYLYDQRRSRSRNL